MNFPLLAETVYLFDEKTRFWGQVVCYLTLGLMFLWCGWPIVQQSLDNRWRTRVVRRADLIPEGCRCPRCEGTAYYCPYLRVSARFPSWQRSWVKCSKCHGSGRLEEIPGTQS